MSGSNTPGLSAGQALVVDADRFGDIIGGDSDAEGPTAALRNSISDNDWANFNKTKVASGDTQAMSQFPQMAVFMRDDHAGAAVNSGAAAAAVNSGAAAADAWLTSKT